MGLNTDGEEMSQGSTIPDGLEPTEKACESEEQPGKKKKIPEEVVCDTRIQDQKLVDGTGTRPFFPLHKMSRHETSDILNFHHNEAKERDRNAGDRGDSPLSVISQRLHSGTVDDTSEARQSTLLAGNTDTPVGLEESPSLPTPAEVMDTKKNDDWDAMYETLLEEMQFCDTDKIKQDLPINPDIDQIDEEGYTPLYKAALKGHLHSVDDLISHGANLDNQSKGGLSPIHAAAQEGHRDIVDYLILQGADVNVECDLGRTPLHTAAKKGHIDIIDSLLGEETDLNKKDKAGWTPFNAAVQYGHLEAVKYLIAKGAKQNKYDLVKFFISEGADVNEEDDEGKIPLHGAATSHVKVMEYPLQQESDVNKDGPKGCTPLSDAVQSGYREAGKPLSNIAAKQDRCNRYTPLFCAAYFGHLHIVKFFISEGADVNKEDDRGMIPLHGAAFSGHIDIMKYLILQGSDLNKGDADGGTPFNAAVNNGHLGAVKYLMSEGAKQNRYDGMTPLYAAARCGHLDLVEFFISEGADVNEEHDEGMIPLHGAATRGHMKVIKYLLQQESDVKKCDSRGWTPFNAAVQYGHVEAVKYLIAKGANQNRYDGMTPLYSAARFGHLDLVELFISEGADVNEEDDEGMIPLHGAAEYGHTEVIKYLVQQGSNVKKKDNTGWTPLHSAVQSGSLEAVEYLMMQGARQNSRDLMDTTLYFHHDGSVGSHREVLHEKDNHKRIPLHIAAANGHIEVIKYLVQEGSDVDKRDRNGWTPLHAAVQSGSLEAVKTLITEGLNRIRYDGMFTRSYLSHYRFFRSEEAVLNLEDENGQIPLHIAAANGHTEIIKYLVQEGSDVKKEDGNGWTPFRTAVQSGHLEAVNCLMTERPNRSKYSCMVSPHVYHDEFFSLTGNVLNKENCRGQIPLHFAAANGHIEGIKYLVQQGSDVNKKDGKGWTPLHAAVHAGHLEAVKYLMNQGAKPCRYEEITPLSLAARFGHLDIVIFFVRKGVDVNEEDNRGQIPLHSAAASGQTEVIKYLAEEGSDVNKKDRKGWTPLHAAVQFGHLEAVKYLIKQGAKECRYDEMTPLSLATRFCHLDVVNFFISKDVDGNKEDNGGPIPLLSAAASGQTEVIKYFDEVLCCLEVMRNLDTAAIQQEESKSRPRVPVKIDLNEEDNRFQSPPFVYDHELGLFIQGGITLDSQDLRRQIPLDVAAASGAIAVVKYLDQEGSDVNRKKRKGCTQFHASDQSGHLGDVNPFLLREVPSQMIAGKDPPIKENSLKLNSVPVTNPHPVAQLKSTEDDPLLAEETASNSGWNRKKKRRAVDNPCSSFIVLVKSLFNVIIALAIILAGSPVLVAGTATADRITLQAGETAVIPFNLTWPLLGGSHFDPYLTLRFESMNHPFCINGDLDVDGFKTPSQLTRFTISIERLATSLCLNLFIESVDILDEDMYEFTVIQHDFQEVLYETFRKEVLVQIPPGPAKCFLTKSENNNYPYEVHCETTTGSSETTLTCYQYGQRVEVKGEITDNGHVTRGVFLLSGDPRFSCCSHDVTSDVNEAMCNDFEWPPSRKTTKTSKTQSTETASPAINSRPINKHTVNIHIPEVESQTRSGARQFMSGLVWCFMYLLIYLSAFVAM